MLLRLLASGLLVFILGGVARAGRSDPTDPSRPHIVTIYNFVRDNDYRMPDSKKVLYEATAKQIQLLRASNLPATFALQYDALIDPKYQRLFKTGLGTNDEIAAWWEIPRALVRAAGLTWRGDHEWDPAANVDFSTGYTPEERRKLVDAYMAKFKAIYGYYPKTVGSWYIDAVTLAYLARQYGIVASCNCKDQIGTDGYTLWGGYWNQAYYPSRLNAYMPAQTRAGQIDVPIFRMLGSDPIYQYGHPQHMHTLEPVYRQGAGGSPQWVKWFMGNFVRQPCLAFAFTQAGQENSFGWTAMKAGLTEQISLFAKLARTGAIQVETLAQAGQWFRRHYAITPPTCVVALDDWKHENRKTVWYDSRFYRINVLWQNGTLFIRDLHCFDQNVVSPTHRAALATTSLAYETLPVMDAARWSGSETDPSGMWPILRLSNGSSSPMTVDGPPVVQEVTPKELSIRQPLDGGGTFSMLCGQTRVALFGMNGRGQPLRWALHLAGGAGQRSVVQSVAPKRINYDCAGTDYALKLFPGSGSCRQLADGDIQLNPNHSGKLVLDLGVAGSEPSSTTNTQFGSNH